jgi:hypothetical protein
MPMQKVLIALMGSRLSPSGMAPIKSSLCVKESLRVLQFEYSGNVFTSFRKMIGRICPSFSRVIRVTQAVLSLISENAPRLFPRYQRFSTQVDTW